MSSTNSKIKITAAGWENFTGDFCMIQFVDGTSVSEVPRPLIDRISACIVCQLVDDSGAEQGQAGAAARHVGVLSVPLDVIEPLEVQTPEQAQAERKAAIESALKNPASKLYKVEELEAIAGDEGLKGIRVIGDKWGVKERSIAKLIDLIMDAQNEYLSRTDERQAQEKAAREAATEAALQAQRDREIAIEKQARNLTAEAEASKIAEAQRLAAEAIENAKAKEAAEAAAAAAAAPATEVPATASAEGDAK